MKAMLAACEFFSVIDTPLPERGWLKDPEVSATKDIVFDKVTFAYPSRPDIKILDQLDLCIEAGKHSHRGFFWVGKEHHRRSCSKVVHPFAATSHRKGQTTGK